MRSEVKSVSVGLVSLGCAKNVVDLQVMAGALLLEGIELSSDPDRADIILVNTCAFIEAARQEAIGEIDRACALKRAGRARFVIVSGCMPQRYGTALAARYPDVDGWLGIDHLFDLPAMIARLVRGGPDGGPVRAEVAVSRDRNTIYEPPVPEFSIANGPHAWLKIAEGCSHACGYCAIPAIRGKLRSRLPKSVAGEARALLRSGVRELDVVAQDVTAYGRDLGDGTSLASLLKTLDRMRGDFWIRLLYGYPTFVTGELLAAIAASRHVCRYIDIPLQHSHPDMLRAMRRADTIRHVGDLPERIRAAIPGAALRTTFIVGYPGESEGHFQHLLDYVREKRFDNVGVFCFSPEEGTPAAAMPGQVSPEVAEERRGRLMLAQREIVDARNASLVGSRMKALVTSRAAGRAEARTEFQAPDVDGATIIRRPPKSLAPGEFTNVEIVSASGYDLVARVVE